MKFLLMSRSGDGLALARRLSENGHDVAAWVMDRRAKKNFDGLVKKVDKWSDFIDAKTIVVFDSNGGGKTGDMMRSRGHHVIGGSVFHDQLEMDRGLAFQLMEEVGIKVPPTESFTDWEAGKAYTKKFEGRLVFKPSGELAKQGADLGIDSYVSYDSEDMIAMLDYFQTLAGSTPAEFELQKFIEGGVAISTEGWFNGKDFMLPFNHTVERKQLMDQNLGPSGGCSGNSVWACTFNNHIIDDGIARMAPTLRSFGYIGPIDLNSIVNEQGVWALEFTPRFGYDALPAFLELYQGDVGELLASLAMLTYPKEMVLKSGFGSALRLSIPPYPSEEYRPKGGVPIRGFERKDRDHLFFYEVRLNNQDQLVTSDSGGAVVSITGWGESIPGSLWGPYDLAKAARIPDKQYRTDMIEKLSEDYSRWETLVQIGKTLGKGA